MPVFPRFELVAVVFVDFRPHFTPEHFAAPTAVAETRFE